MEKGETSIFFSSGNVFYLSHGQFLFNSLPSDKILDGSKFKGLADNKVTEKLKIMLGRVENIVRKGENAGNQHFLLFP